MITDTSILCARAPRAADGTRTRPGISESAREAAFELVEQYRCRWEIETSFNVLKNGYRGEASQLCNGGKAERTLAVYRVVSRRLAGLIWLGTIHPEWSADLFFSAPQWAGACLPNKKNPTKEAPTLREVVRLIAQTGGFLTRRGDGEPGVKSLWLGMQRLRDFFFSELSRCGRSIMPRELFATGWLSAYAAIQALILRHQWCYVLSSANVRELQFMGID